MASILLGSLCVLALSTVHLAIADKVAVSNCDGFVSPAGCKKGVNCAYEASWILSDPVPTGADPSGQADRAVTFNITIRRPVEKASHFYTAIGFSEHQAMPDTDVVIGYAYNNNFLNHIVDGYITPAGTNPPVVDTRQDVVNTNGHLIDDPADSTKKILAFTFTRKLDTGDKTQDVSLTECRYFFFMTSGGDVGGPGGNSFSKHDLTPDMSAEKICLTKCQAGGGSNGAQKITAWNVSFVLTILFAACARL